MVRPRLRLLSAACAAIAISGLTLSACSSSTSSGTDSTSKSTVPFSTATPGVLTVGVVGSDAPGFITSADGTKISGIVGDIINGFAVKYHLKVKVTVSSDYGAFVLGIQQGKFDLGAGLAYSAQRSKIIRYSVPWLEAPLMAITRAGFAYTGPASVSAGRVGTGTGVAWAGELQSWNSGTKLFASTSVEKQALLSGEIDVALINGDAVLNEPFSAKNAAAYPVKAGDFGIDAKLIQSAEFSATACKNSSLMTVYSSYIVNLDKADGLDPIYTRYNSPDGSKPSSFTAPASC